MPIPLNVIAPKAQRLIWSTVSGFMSVSPTCYSTNNQKSHISILISPLPPFYTIPPSVPPFSFSSNNVLLIARLTKIVFLFSLFPFFFYTYQHITHSTLGIPLLLYLLTTLCHKDPIVDACYCLSLWFNYQIVTVAAGSTQSIGWVGYTFSVLEYQSNACKQRQKCTTD